MHVGNRTVPPQLLVRSPKGGNKPAALPLGASIPGVQAALPDKKDIVELDGLRLYSLSAAFVACSANFLVYNPTDARAALSVARDASDVLVRLAVASRQRDMVLATALL